MLTSDVIFKQLQTQFYAPVPFEIEHSVLLEAMEAFFKFLEEPAEVKEHINFTIAPQHRRGDVGFKHREAADHIYNDSKDFFHFHPALLRNYANFLDKHPVVLDFMLKAKPIWDLAYQTVFNVLQVLDGQFAGVTEKVFAAEPAHVLLRFLRYDWQQSGKYLAKPHFDAGSFTLAIAESSPGLRIGSCPDDLQLIEHVEGQAIFMLASNFKQLMPSADFKAGWHDVIQLDDTLVGKPFARWAIVAFIEGHGVKALPRTETHKWYIAEQSG
ncbi:hypothetical protein [Legionella jordanis]|uniref:Fe2OG dioxygenase domain-containing protein n=1 Tax=Legionella jordanis TaxID=456 RepID=A0A0W0VB13_9GAMM|nr:hypothetical protein [Legionella jordanis]KTD17062.1 hypothetical protein Ljor_1368 [Legionella jordanis]RMX03195.1 hypothetical protein EAW55_07135 [Legionella jordanis]RMX18665.1 hypothetical protein EAS68_07560 [Legionella jordanis]VEH12741.1 Uncharacterised protein [Legionella jordanis]HAT8713110.1 hypothetical protein [Legionella jordanis]